MSCAGMPSVMAQISRTPASAASMMESAQNAAGTKMMVASAPASLTASLTVLNTGRSRCRLPPLPGRDAAHEVGAVRGHLLAVKRALVAR